MLKGSHCLLQKIHQIKVFLSWCQYPISAIKGENNTFIYSYVPKQLMEGDMFCLDKSCSCCKTSSNTSCTALGESQIGFKEYLSSDFHMGADRQCCWPVLTINTFLCFFSLYHVHKYNTWVCYFKHLITELGLNSNNPLKIKIPQCNKVHGTLINSTCVVWIVDSCFGLLLYEALLRNRLKYCRLPVAADQTSWLL